MGLKQGCVLSLLLSSIVLEYIIKVSKKKCKSLTLGNWKINNMTWHDSGSRKRSATTKKPRNVSRRTEKKKSTRK